MLLLSLGISGVSSLFAAKGTDAAGKESAYACGQNIDVNKHTAGLRRVLPHRVLLHDHARGGAHHRHGAGGEWLSAVLFIAVALLALKVLFRRDDYVSD